LDYPQKTHVSDMFSVSPRDLPAPLTNPQSPESFENQAVVGMVSLHEQSSCNKVWNMGYDFLAFFKTADSSVAILLLRCKATNSMSKLGCSQSTTC